jgi:DNA-binding response OmpR family regulator
MSGCRTWTGARCAALRGAGVSAPIIMLTAADTDADTILGLNSGANDYITKPFRMGVLLARLRAQLRQYAKSEDAIFTIGPYTFRPAAKMLLDQTSKEKIRLTGVETAILKYLYRAGSRVIGRDTVRGGLGLQCRGHQPYAGDPRLSPAPEDRARSNPRRNPGE